MRFRNDDLLVYIAVADAYAAAVEYLKYPRDQAVRDACLRFVRYQQHPTHTGLVPGLYTDDTEMSVAIASVLIAYGFPFSRLDFAEAFVREFLFGGRREGYARGFQKFLESVKDGADFLRRIRPDSDKNGAAMRAVPLGVLPIGWCLGGSGKFSPLLDAATTQAKVTHDTPEGRFSSRAVALMSHFALYEELPLAELGDYCLEKLPQEDIQRFGYVFLERWPGTPVVRTARASVAVTTVHAVFDLVTHGTSLMGIMEKLIRWGGDTDSVAAIAWGIASCRMQGERLPEFMMRDLEQGNPRTGVARLRDVGTRLMEKYER